MSTANKKNKYVTMRIPVDVLERLRCEAQELQEYLANAGSLKQQKAVYLRDGTHEREQFFIAPWKIVDRLLHRESLRKQRHKRYRNKQKSPQPEPPKESADVNSLQENE